MTFSRTVILPNSSTVWNVLAIPLVATWWAFRPLKGSPLNRISPSDGRKKPEIMLMRVVFPAPLGPIMDVIVPWVTSKERSNMA